MFSFLNGNLFSINIFFTDSSIVPIPYVPNFGLLLLSIENFDLNSKDNICLVDWSNVTGEAVTTKGSKVVKVPFSFAILNVKVSVPSCSRGNPSFIVAKLPLLSTTESPVSTMVAFAVIFGEYILSK